MDKLKQDHQKRMETLKQDHQKRKQEHEKRMETAKQAFSSVAAKIKAKTANTKRPIQRKKFKNRIDAAKEDLSSFAQKLKARTSIKDTSVSTQSRFSSFAARFQKKEKPKLVTEKFCTLHLEISNVIHAQILGESDKVLFSGKLGEMVPTNTEFSVERCEDVLTVNYAGYGELTITHMVLDGKL